MLRSCPVSGLPLNRSRPASMRKGGCAVSWADDPLVKAAIPLSPETVLRTLASVSAGDAPPLFTVHLAGGHVVSGGPVTVGADRGSDVVVLADPETGQLAYALLSSVVAVELRNPQPFQDVLTGGRLPLPQVGEPVTRLALQREFTPTQDLPVDVDWASLDGSGPVIGNMASLLSALRDAVAAVRADDMGRRAWAQVRTLRVEHHAGSPLSVLPITEGLAVQADLTAALPRGLPGELVRQISALL